MVTQPLGRGRGRFRTHTGGPSDGMTTMGFASPLPHMPPLISPGASVVQSPLTSPRLTPRATPREIVYPGRQGQEGQELGSLPSRVTIEAVGAGPSGTAPVAAQQPRSPREKFRNRGKAAASNKTAPSVAPPVVPLVVPPQQDMQVTPIPSGARFDPNTGQPLPIPSGAMFDPNTGQPLGIDPNAGQAMPENKEEEPVFI